LTSSWGLRERVLSGEIGELAWQLIDMQTPQPCLVDHQTRDVKATENFLSIPEQKAVKKWPRFF